MEAGAFALVRRGVEWDEVLLAAHLEGPEWIVRTTAGSGQFGWGHLAIAPGEYRMLVGLSATRRAPADVNVATINGIYVGPNLDRRWSPTIPEVVSLCREAADIAEL
eukprot:11007249-Lingulodinium_polyedra.AAC.1